MAKMSPDAATESQSLDDHLSDVMAQMVVTTKPVMVCGVQRKANIGNYENIDIYCAVALPIDLSADMNSDELTAALSEVAKYGFHVTSTETLTRYKKVKESNG